MKTACVLLLAGWTAFAAQPRPRVLVAGTLAPTGASILTVTASPSSIGFSANDPDNPVPGSATATVYWVTDNTNPINGNWTLSVNTATASFPNCPSVPVSAVLVTCAAVSGTKGGKGSCMSSGAVPLSTNLATVAYGPEITGSRPNNPTYTVNLAFTLADSWRYIAQNSPSCSLDITYTINVP